MSPHSDRDASDELGIDGEELYIVLRKAIEDAMLNVIGTLVLVGIAIFFVVIGGYVFFTGADPVGPIIGTGIILIGFYFAGVTLEVIPHVREWF